MRFKNYIAILLVFIVSLIGCERERNYGFENIDCTECYQKKPEWGPISITVTINDENPYVPLVVYIGDIEDNNVDWVDTAYTTDFWIDVKPDRYHSLSAKYKVGDKTVFAVDGDELKLKYTTSDCDEPCYYYKGGYFDVRLLN